MTLTDIEIKYRYIRYRKHIVPDIAVDIADDEITSLMAIISKSSKSNVIGIKMIDAIVIST